MFQTWKKKTLVSSKDELQPKWIIWKQAVDMPTGKSHFGKQLATTP